MKRQTKSLVTDTTENVPLIQSYSEKAGKIEDALDTAANDSDEFVDFSAFGDSLPENVMLERKLDAIFCDVASKLPAIDFDMSDVSCVS